MKEGYIKLSRRFFDNPLWTEHREYSRAEAWIDLIQSAKFDSSSVILNGRAIEVQRGEIVASRRYLETRWKWSNTKVDNFLKLLIEQGMVTKRNASQNTVLTLTNYSTYNNVNATENADETPTKRQQNATRTPNIKKEKKGDKGNIYPPNPQGLKEDSEAMLDDSEIYGSWERKKFRQKKEIDFSFVSHEFKPIVIRWLEYKAAKGQKYKNSDSLQTMYQKLLKFSKNSPEIAVEVIEDAMAKNYSGFFELKNKMINGTATKKNNSASSAELAEAIADGISRARTKQEWE